MSIVQVKVFHHGPAAATLSIRTSRERAGRKKKRLARGQDQGGPLPSRPVSQRPRVRLSRRHRLSFYPEEPGLASLKEPRAMGAETSIVITARQ
ncbi:hypothetical protein C8035_v010641 [Colletotrichum spinosum]|uniref:Uncharacterized protein n=1 Tax=Colletotrichum spinosum TaxID=1347390 RepID=A0A4R8QA32_9PEZI|nr:hypothetical protein C8035_v010641 [Colletotrichum spinosum]